MATVLLALADLAENEMRIFDGTIKGQEEDELGVNACHSTEIFLG
jgi:hypothetical protein